MVPSIGHEVLGLWRLRAMGDVEFDLSKDRKVKTRAASQIDDKDFSSASRPSVRSLEQILAVDPCPCRFLHSSLICFLLLLFHSIVLLRAGVEYWWLTCIEIFSQQEEKWPRRPLLLWYLHPLLRELLRATLKRSS